MPCSAPLANLVAARLTLNILRRLGSLCPLVLLLCRFVEALALIVLAPSLT